ncbi:MAG: hypothetical protein ABIQ49_06125 [Gemmatimonadales bacterium]
MEITTLQPRTDSEILGTYPVMRQLRPDVPPDPYVPMLRGLMEREGHRLVALAEEGQVRAVAGYRFMEMLYCGRILYVDDLVTDERVRSRGFDRRLLDWLKDSARGAPFLRAGSFRGNRLSLRGCTLSGPRLGDPAGQARGQACLAHTGIVQREHPAGLQCSTEGDRAAQLAKIYAEPEATRGSIGFYMFAPPGANERVIREAGFELLGARDVTENATLVSRRWHDARAAHRDALLAREGEANFEGLQRFLPCVHALTSERRLSRFCYVARKPGVGAGQAT